MPTSDKYILDFGVFYVPAQIAGTTKAPVPGFLLIHYSTIRPDRKLSEQFVLAYFAPADTVPFNLRIK
jgi:hypothetical protein